MPGSRTEIPYPGLAGSGEQTVPDQFVARPLANDRARDISDVVLIEAEDRAQVRFAQRVASAREAISVQALEVHAFFEIDLCRAGRLKRPMPAMRRLQIVFVDGKELRPTRLLCHSSSPL